MTLQQVTILGVQASILPMVFGFGLRTTVGDVLYVVRRPALLGRSLLAMFVIMPIAAIAMAWAFTFRPPVEITLVALSISPIPPLLAGRAEKAGGHQPYALGLMVVAGLLSIVTVPVVVEILERTATRPMAMSPGAIAALVLRTNIVPLAAGLAIRELWPSAAARLIRPVDTLSKAWLAIALLAILATTLPAALELIGNGTIIAMVAFVVTGLAVGHWLGGPEPNDRTVLAIFTATRHPAIALAIAKANFPEEPYLGAAIVLFLLVNLLVGVPYHLRRKRRRIANVAGRYLQESG